MKKVNLYVGNHFFDRFEERCGSLGKNELYFLNELFRTGQLYTEKSRALREFDRRKKKVNYKGIDPAATIYLVPIQASLIVLQQEGQNYIVKTIYPDQSPWSKRVQNIEEVELEWGFLRRETEWSV